MQGRAGLAIALTGHAFVVVLLVLAGVQGGVAVAVRLAVATPLPTRAPP